MTASVRSTTDPFAPALTFPGERFRRLLGDDAAERLAARFSSFDYPDAREWATSVRGVHEDDLRARFTVPADATPETLLERLRDDLVELAHATGASNVSGTKEEIVVAILATVPEPVTPPTPVTPTPPAEPVGEPTPEPVGEPAPVPVDQTPTAEAGTDAPAETADAPSEEPAPLLGTPTLDEEPTPDPVEAPAAADPVVASPADAPAEVAADPVIATPPTGELPVDPAVDAGVPADADSAPVEADADPVADGTPEDATATAAKRTATRK